MRKVLSGVCIVVAGIFNPVVAAETAPVSFEKGVTRAELTKILTSHGMTVKDATENESDPWLKAKAPKGTDQFKITIAC